MNKIRIVVYYLSAQDGGGLFVLKQFYNEVVERQDDNIEWYFIVSTDQLSDCQNVRIIKHKKQNALNRLIYESIILNKEINSLNPDLVISLQNMPIRGCKQKQYVYLHQSLQFCSKRFSFFKSIERSLAVRQHLVCEMYHRSLPAADHIFVQTNWIKRATAKWIKVSDEKITVVPVEIKIDRIPVKDYIGKESKQFFYPARAEIYKNHEVIIEACKILVLSGIKDFNVVLTIDKNDNEYASSIVKKAQGLPIEFVGALPYEDIWGYYSNSTLLFPSYLETCGLPLIEARIAGSRIIASDLEFSHEALDGYQNAMFFNHICGESLANLMKYVLLNPAYSKTKTDKDVKKQSLLDSMLDLYMGDL